MKLSALDIRKQEFAKVFRGYDPEEVDSFRHMLSQQWHLLTEDVRRLENRIQDQTEKLEHYRKVEEALEEALQTARDGARERMEQADRRSETVLQDAEAKAEVILRRAEQRAQRMVAEAEEFRRQARRIHGEATLRRNEIVTRLRSLLESQLEHVRGFEASEDERAKLNPVEDPDDYEVPTFTASAPASATQGYRDYPEYAEEEPALADEEVVKEEEGFDFRDMADLEATPVEGRIGEEDAGPAVDQPEEEEGDASGSDEEIRKIRRILEDLDG